MNPNRHHPKDCRQAAIAFHEVLPFGGDLQGAHIGGPLATRGAGNARDQQPMLLQVKQGALKRVFVGKRFYFFPDFAAAVGAGVTKFLKNRSLQVSIKFHRIFLSLMNVVERRLG